MSEHFWTFAIECPICKKRVETADGYETDDWAEVFAFSGRSPKNEWSKDSSKYYKCNNCGSETEVDELYRLAYISTDSIDDIKKYLFRMIYYVVSRGSIYDHGWEPDLLKAIERYSLLYPEDSELVELRRLYFYALHAPFLLPEKYKKSEE